ncbi:hypothetical protein BDV37DRAFT_255367 [Aspergillus pseudonomiae]|uniref:Uncharacterized protein n=1 Tax=Aspergillus pseudonomiae TaxID=1506151 RepID=A0A5N7D4L2_9EURO|nr:uncharacterized protein BDV37DRAFT_255367 [Aspergillus pseudonomiae]KAE8401361.1 hypothetical protein BDV37DRAFT_255367 [Aspergillus pseudonomiae]
MHVSRSYHCRQSGFKAFVHIAFIVKCLAKQCKQLLIIFSISYFHGSLTMWLRRQTRIPLIAG